MSDSESGRELEVSVLEAELEDEEAAEEDDKEVFSCDGGSDGEGDGEIEGMGQGKKRKKRVEENVVSKKQDVGDKGLGGGNGTGCGKGDKEKKKHARMSKERKEHEEQARLVAEEVARLERGEDEPSTLKPAREAPPWFGDVSDANGGQDRKSERENEV
mmetsp:Transcript_7597/g.12292  ORF Transcript_7597/g.12292 Transcript_7597/m.12292 type:complete len:159 (+) Transcript_7597:469-945(+)|eukprot:CAMPEP_0203762728 /NCGR_PEP_ID=MMETSP0098-20131031/15549_1 /ASSEMBLY_ACC=CAM_ASM_000208 /TAXON_ID=96639 /ORGANISM=" , Strain NY0313808BC1" /LENGTH=158 /DNA_ID=CAMNT_0050657249 /DNA_START=743 /DNA_END=1219 /DNA_ORIENTATION=-